MATRYAFMWVGLLFSRYIVLKIYMDTFRDDLVHRLLLITGCV